MDKIMQQIKALQRTFVRLIKRPALCNGKGAKKYYADRGMDFLGTLFGG